MIYSKDDVKRMLDEIREFVKSLDGEMDSYTIAAIVKKLKGIEAKL